jgi:hypothetical protein
MCSCGKQMGKKPNDVLLLYSYGDLCFFFANIYSHVCIFYVYLLWHNHLFYYGLYTFTEYTKIFE